MLSKRFYLGSLIGGYAASFVLSITAGVLAVMQEVSPWEAEGGLFVLAAIAATLYVAAVSLILWWKAWKSVQDFGARTTPGQAIGFLFIPVVNLYWVFQAFWGFSKDYNGNVEFYKLSIQRLPEKLFLAYTIVLLLTTLLSWAPLFNAPLNLASFVLSCIVAGKLVDAVNHISGVPRPENRGMVF